MNLLYKHLFFYFLFLIAFLCHAGPSDLKISGYRQGLIAFNDKGKPYIYKVGNNFTYKTNGSCVAVGKKHDCMWYGFEFDFESPEEVTEIHCITLSNNEIKLVNPHENVSSGSNLAKWGYTLYGRRGHYIRPQYTSGSNPTGENQTLTYSDKCHYQGVVFSESELTLHFPKE